MARIAVEQELGVRHDSAPTLPFAGDCSFASFHNVVLSIQDPDLDELYNTTGEGRYGVVINRTGRERGTGNAEERGRYERGFRIEIGTLGLQKFLMNLFIT